MKWLKQGLIFAPNKEHPWMISHASVPVADHVSEEVLRIYFGTRDADGRSHIGYVDVEAENPRNVIKVSAEPVLPLGPLGTFDDNGMMPSWLVKQGDRKYFYYIGWNPQVTVSYRLSIGLAIAESEQGTFAKHTDGPISDRGIDEPYFTTAPCVRCEKGIWRMWYVSCTGWTNVDNHPEPHYNIKYADSRDGIHWRRTGHVCIQHDGPNHAVGRPCVFMEAGKYRMIYSHRKTQSYRSDQQCSYRLGYAESENGLDWLRKDDEVGIARSPTGWDSGMIEYCFVLAHGAKTYLFYNGDGFGISGFGYAVRENDNVT